MSIFDWLEEKLGIHDIEKRLRDVERKTDRLEREMNAMKSDLTDFRGFNDRTKEELIYMRGQIENMLRTIERLIQIQENQEHLEDAKRLLSRMRNIRTRINNALIAA